MNLKQPFVTVDEVHTGRGGGGMGKGLNVEKLPSQ